MTDVSILSSAPVIPVAASEKAHERRELSDLALLAAAGLFFSVLTYAHTPSQFWPVGTAALAPETPFEGLVVSKIPIPAGLQVSGYSAH